MDVLYGMSLFVEVAKARSFTRAAETLAMPTSTLSRRIGEIEASLGLKLFHRTTRSVGLTDAGALYFSRAVSLVEAAAEAHAHVRGLAERPAGLLRISMETEIGPSLIAPVVASFRTAYPDVGFELDLSPRRVDLLAENYDIAIRLGSLPDSTLTVRRLALLDVGLYAAPGYVARRGSPGHPGELKDHARIHLMHQHDGGEWSLTRDAETVVVPSDRSLSANNMAMILQLARSGAGIAVSDELVAARECETGRLVSRSRRLVAALRGGVRPDTRPHSARQDPALRRHAERPGLRRPGRIPSTLIAKPRHQGPRQRRARRVTGASWVASGSRGPSAERWER